MTELLTFLHLLILVYWLGGDLGAFVASRILVDPARPAPARLAAAELVGGIDMAPRSALILAFPTGFALAAASGWIDPPDLAVPAAWVAGFAWLALAWAVHLHVGPHALMRRIDLAARWLALVGLIAGAALILAGVWPGPRFFAAKLAVLAAAILFGLVIRAQIAPLFPALARLKAEAALDAAGEAAVRGAMGRVRIVVLAIWTLLVLAALIGVYAPRLA